MHPSEWLRRAARARPDGVALETACGLVTYAELDARADEAAGALAARGAGVGSRVALLLPAGEGFVVALWAALRLGAVAMPVDLRLGDEERAAQLASAEVVVDAPLGGRGAVLPHGRPATTGQDSPALVVHTSGTSGAAQAVELTAGNLLWSALGSAVALGLDRDERWLCPLPLSHVGGLSVLLRSALYGTTAVLHPGWDTERVAAALRDEGITVVSLVPTMLRRLLDAGLERPPALRVALVGGGPLDPALAERARAAGIPVVETYGLTEAASQVTTGGFPLPGVEVELGEDGEILVSGPTVAPGALADDGRLHTGDLGRLDESGRLVVVGRKADTIVTGGENVAPAEVEAVLRAHPGVEDVAVHGRPDPEWGEAVVATVVPRDGQSVSEADLRAHAADHLARYKVPKTVEFAPDLPRTASGKVIRAKLR